jgi:hypothetical protein
MALDMSKIASEMLRVADAIEKEAAEKTYFVCDRCNHTANIASIDKVRSKVASESGIKTVSPVSVNDTVACPVIECGGTMHYAATDESDKYYIDVEAGMEGEEPEGEEPESEEPESEEPEGEEPEGEEPEGEEPEGEEPEDSKFSPVDEREEGSPADDESESLIEEEVTQEEPKEKPKKKPAKKDKADDGKAVPKFTEMPEDMKDLKVKASSDRFAQSVARYSSI